MTGIVSPAVRRYQAHRRSVQATIARLAARTPKGLSAADCWSCDGTGMDEDTSGYPGAPTRARRAPKLCTACKGFRHCEEN